MLMENTYDDIEDYKSFVDDIEANMWGWYRLGCSLWIDIVIANILNSKIMKVTIKYTAIDIQILIMVMLSVLLSIVNILR